MMKKYPRFRLASAAEAQKDIMVEFLRLSYLRRTVEGDMSEGDKHSSPFCPRPSHDRCNCNSQN